MGLSEEDQLKIVLELSIQGIATYKAVYMCVYVKYSNMPARYVHILLYFIMIYYIHNVIRECGSTLYVGLAHAAPPNQYKAFTTFSTN